MFEKKENLAAVAEVRIAELDTISRELLKRWKRAKIHRFFPEKTAVQLRNNYQGNLHLSRKIFKFPHDSKK